MAKVMVLCPGGCGGRCGGEAVVADYGTERARTVRVAPCTVLVRQGWTGHQAAYYKTDAALRPVGLWGGA